MKYHVDRFDTNKIVSAVESLYNKPTPSDQPEMSLVISSMMNELAGEAVMLGSIDWDLVYYLMAVKEGRISGVLSSVRNTLNPLWFTNALVNDAAVSKFSISVGATSALPPYISYDLWCEDESM